MGKNLHSPSGDTSLAAVSEDNPTPHLDCESRALGHGERAAVPESKAMPGRSQIYSMCCLGKNSRNWSFSLSDQARGDFIREFPGISKIGSRRLASKYW
jgi:hypothetical protein